MKIIHLKNIAYALYKLPIFTLWLCVFCFCQIKNSRHNWNIPNANSAFKGTC